MTRFANRAVAVVATAVVVGHAFAQVAAPTAHAGHPTPAPEFTGTAAKDWINSAPLKMADLAGKIVLLDVWTFDCGNCSRSIPWLLSLEDRYGSAQLQIVGIHAPEFAHEKSRARVAERIETFEIEHPIMLDNDFAYWRALGNRYWPTFYVVDGAGLLRGVFVGETHAGDERARKVEALIERLLER